MQTPARTLLNVGAPPAASLQPRRLRRRPDLSVRRASRRGRPRLSGGDVAGADPLRRRAAACPAGSGRFLAGPGRLRDRLPDVRRRLRRDERRRIVRHWPQDPPTRTTVITDLVLPGALVEMSMIAVPDGGGRARSFIRRTGSAHRIPTATPSGPATRCSCRASSRATAATTTVVPGDVAAQTRVVLDNAGEILAAAGMTHANVVSARVFLPDARDVRADERRVSGVFSVEPAGTRHSPCRPRRPLIRRRDDVHRLVRAARSSSSRTSTRNPNLSAADRRRAAASICPGCSATRRTTRATSGHRRPRPWRVSGAPSQAAGCTRGRRRRQPGVSHGTCGVCRR